MKYPRGRGPTWKDLQGSVWQEGKFPFIVISTRDALLARRAGKIIKWSLILLPWAWLIWERV